MNAAISIGQISNELISLLGSERQVQPFSRRRTRFDLKEAYEVVNSVNAFRRSRGERPIGRKIGFTNKMIWGDRGISAPIWNFVYDQTVADAVAGKSEIKLSGMPEPRIEPEIVVHLASTPRHGMTAIQLIGCIDWVAPGFEVVFSIFPNWEFDAADAAAAYGVHGALVIGQKLDITRERAERAAEIATFNVRLNDNRGNCRKGCAENVLGGPAEALKYLVEELARYPNCEALRNGEIVTTGTLTEAMPARAGDVWTAQFGGIELAPLELRLV